MKKSQIKKPTKRKGAVVPRQTTALKNNIKDCKPPIKYVSPNFIEGVAFGMLAGEIKYEAWNYLFGHDVQDLLDGAVRHINKHRKGEIYDDDTTERLREKFGENAPRVRHLWLAGCNLNMIQWQQDYETSRNSLPSMADIQALVASK